MDQHAFQDLANTEFVEVSFYGMRHPSVTALQCYVSYHLLPFPICPNTSMGDPAVSFLLFMYSVNDKILESVCMAT